MADRVETILKVTDAGSSALNEFRRAVVGREGLMCRRFPVRPFTDRNVARQVRTRLVDPAEAAAVLARRFGKRWQELLS